MRAARILISTLSLLLLSGYAEESPNGFEKLGLDQSQSRSDRDYGDIEFSFEFQTNSNLDCGIRLRENGRIPIGSKSITSMHWHAIRVIHLGNRIWTWMDEELVVDGSLLYPYSKTDNPLPKKGSIRFLSESEDVRWRHLYIREIDHKEAIKRLRDNEAAIGFTPIFNGENLDGWTGEFDGKTVKDGILHWEYGGSLYTQKTYRNFAFRFEFTLSPGANNGLAIRSSGAGDPAYEAMAELQILDNSAEKFAELDNRQYHGSAYGMSAARRGYLRKTGQWNYQEVTVIDSTIRVELNGTIILDTDLADVTEYFQNKEHPGKSLKEGYLGFAAHGTHHLRFRNMSVREID